MPVSQFSIIILLATHHVQYHRQSDFKALAYVNITLTYSTFKDCPMNLHAECIYACVFFNACVY